MEAMMQAVVGKMGANPSGNAGRIDFDGQASGGCLPSGNVTINRTIPTILDGQLSISSWTLFCEDIDRALQPLTSIKKKFGIVAIIKSFATLSLFIFFMLAFIPFDYNPDRNVFNRRWLLITLIPLGVFLALFFVSNSLTSRYEEMIEEVKKICTKKSNEHSSMTFHLRDDIFTQQARVLVSARGTSRTHYIEVIVGDGRETNVSNLEAGFNTIPSVAIESRGQTRVAQRLQELDGIRSLITEQEYQQKKQDILSNI